MQAPRGGAQLVVADPPFLLHRPHSGRTPRPTLFDRYAAGIFFGVGHHHKLRTPTGRLHVATIAPPLRGVRRAMRSTMPDDMALSLHRAVGS